jgi:aspartate-semialdehyde dehydrogenase
VGFEKPVAHEEILTAFQNFTGEPQKLGLPSAPPKPVIYMTQHNRPQPRIDVEKDGGMSVYVGRLRPCPILGHKFVLLGHNTIRGAAGAAILNAELMESKSAS